MTLVAVLFGAAAFWITLRARFLAYPDWLAVQKADLILGPIGVGLYWRYRRPENRLGLMLIALGLLGIPYILESTTAPVAFGTGVLWEYPIYFMTEVVILAFPNGRLDGRAERLILAGALAMVISGVIFVLTSPQFAPAFSISGCRAACPANGLAIWSPLSWAQQLNRYSGVILIAVALATACLLVWRFATGTAPRRRAVAIGTPIALVFLLMQATYRVLFLVAPNGLSVSAQPVQDALQWTFAGARAALWYGFLLALIVAELFAGRALRRLVGESLGRPSFRELEGMLRGPLGDPGVRLGVWRPRTRDWGGADGASLAPPGRGQTLTTVQRDGEPAAAIVHDAQLAEDPELLNAAGAVALLAAENVELDAAWKKSVRELSDSRSRITKASDTERRKLERDLHDGAQQRLLAALMTVSAASESASDDPDLRAKLSRAADELGQGIEELRELAHGIYPAALTDYGLASAIGELARRSGSAVSVTRASEDRFAPETEAAMYYCCLEAIQNTSKHAGPDARTSIRLYTDADQLHLDVRDDGPGFDPSRAPDGAGLENMRDRLGAIDGYVEILCEPGHGTLVAAHAPLSNPPPRDTPG